MTRIDFYITNSDSIDDRHQLACRLTEKAWRMGHTVYIHTNDAEHSNSLDELLWQYKPESFVPHQLSGQQLSGQQHNNPIEIGHNDQAGEHHDILINLSLSTPPFFSRFQRMIEIVCQQPAIRDESRKRYKFYKDRGYSLTTHNL